MPEYGVQKPGQQESLEETLKRIRSNAQKRAHALKRGETEWVPDRGVGTVASDFWKSVKEGFVGAVGADIGLAGSITQAEPIQKAGVAVQQYAEDISASKSPLAKQAAEKRFFEEVPLTEEADISFLVPWDKTARINADLGEAWTDLRSYINLAGNAIGSVGALFLSGGILKEVVKKGALEPIAKYFLKKRADDLIRRGLAQTPEAASKMALEQLGRKIKAFDTAAGVASFSTAEGVMIAGAVDQAVRDEIFQLTPAEINKSPRFQQIYWQIKEENPDISVSEAHKQAWEQLAREAGLDAAVNAGTQSGVLGGPLGFILNRYLPGGNLLSKIQKRGKATGLSKALDRLRAGALTVGEVATEAAQGGIEEYYQQSALKNYVDPEREIDWVNVLESAVQEGLGMIPVAAGLVVGRPGGGESPGGEQPPPDDIRIPTRQELFDAGTLTKPVSELTTVEKIQLNEAAAAIDQAYVEEVMDTVLGAEDHFSAIKAVIEEGKRPADQSILNAWKQIQKAREEAETVDPDRTAEIMQTPATRDEILQSLNQVIEEGRRYGQQPQEERPGVEVPAQPEEAGGVEEQPPPGDQGGQVEQEGPRVPAVEEPEGPQRPDIEAPPPGTQGPRVPGVAEPQPGAQEPPPVPPRGETEPPPESPPPSPGEAPPLPGQGERQIREYTVSSEDRGDFPVGVIRYPDGSAVLIDRGEDAGPPSEYDAEFGKDKTDEELLRYQFEPLGVTGVSAVIEEGPVKPDIEGPGPGVQRPQPPPDGPGGEGPAPPNSPGGEGPAPPTEVPPQRGETERPETEGPVSEPPGPGTEKPVEEKPETETPPPKPRKPKPRKPKAEKPSEKKEEPEGIGPRIRRWWEREGKHKDDVDVILDKIFGEVSRANVFSPRLAANATPGAQRAVKEIRGIFDSYLNWAGTRAGGSRGSTWLTPREAIKRVYNGEPVHETKSGGVRFTRESNIPQGITLPTIGNFDMVLEYAERYAEFMQRLSATMNDASNVDEVFDALKNFLYPQDVRTDESSNYNRHPRSFDWMASLEAAEAAIWANKRDNLSKDAITSSRQRLKSNEDAKSVIDPRRRTRVSLTDLAERRDNSEMPNWRQGRDVDMEEIVGEFGLGGWTWGDWVKKGKRKKATKGDKERQLLANLIYDSLADLAYTLGIPRKAIGIEGELKVAVGALGQGKAHAAFYSDNYPIPPSEATKASEVEKARGLKARVINFTKTMGDGTVAHEWGHAFDFLMRRKGYVAQMDAVIDNLKKDFDTRWLDKTVKIYFGYINTSGIDWTRRMATSSIRYRSPEDTRYYVNALRGDNGKAGKYWSKDTELFARAVESYVYDQLEGTSPFLVSDDVAEGVMSPPAYSMQPYPEGKDRANINVLLHNFFEQVGWEGATPSLDADAKIGWSQEFEEYRQQLLDGGIEKMLQAEMERLLEEQAKGQDQGDDWFDGMDDDDIDRVIDDVFVPGDDGGPLQPPRRPQKPGQKEIGRPGDRQRGVQRTGENSGDIQSIAQEMGIDIDDDHAKYLQDILDMLANKPVSTEDLYQKLIPFFSQIYHDSREKGMTVKQFVEAIRAMEQVAGSNVLINPLRRFMREVRDGEIDPNDHVGTLRGYAGGGAQGVEPGEQTPGPTPVAGGNRDETSEPGGEPGGPGAGVRPGQPAGGVEGPNVSVGPEGYPGQAQIGSQGGFLSQLEGITRSAAISGETQAKYRPVSKGFNENVLAPVNMVESMHRALSDIEEAVGGDLDAWVADQLGYESVERLYDGGLAPEKNGGLMALQVDGVAAALYAMNERGRSVIIADQTGVGKGRQAAPIIRWAIKNNKLPVFVTRDTNLFTDMYGDLRDIGSNDVRPHIMNNNGFILDENGKKIFETKNAQERNEQIINTGKLPNEANALFMTYSQVSRRGNRQQRAVERLVKDHDVVFILDESHEAAGVEKIGVRNSQSSNTARFFVEQTREAWGTTYVSATFAKRPEHLAFYFRTDMADALDSVEELVKAMERGGIRLQTIVSQMLTRSGQLLRRERSFEGININTTVYTDTEQEDRELNDQVTGILRNIHFNLDKYSQAAIKDRQEDIFRYMIQYMRDNKRQLGLTDQKIDDIAHGDIKTRIYHHPFAAEAHLYIQQLLLGVKAKRVVDYMLEEIKKGNTMPIIGLENTMMSFLEEYVRDNGLKPGSVLDDFDWKTYLRHIIKKTTRVSLRTRKDEEGEFEPVEIDLPDNLLGGDYLRNREAVLSDVSGLDIDLPIMPIDYIKSMLKKRAKEELGKDLRIEEITGRSTIAVDYTGAVPRLVSYSKPEKNQLIRDFQEGRIDILIINEAGAVGLSLHSDKRLPKEQQKQRHMIVIQPMADVVKFVQLLGRINRTNQATLPQYDIFVSSIPAETRLLASLMKKLKSLNANVSANTESASSVNAIDFMNKYGDQVVKEWLQNPDNALALELQLMFGISERDADLATKVASKIALMPVVDQANFYSSVEGDYNALIDHLDQTGQNELTQKFYDYKATPVRERQLVPGKGGTSAFGQPAHLVEFYVDRLNPPPDGAEVRRIAEEAAKKQPQRMEEFSAIYEKRLAEIQKEIDRLQSIAPEKRTPDQTRLLGRRRNAVDRLNSSYQQLVKIINRRRIGNIVTYVEQSEEGSLDYMYATVLDYQVDDKKDEENPFALSRVRVTLLTNTSDGTIKVPLSQHNKQYRDNYWDNYERVYDELTPKIKREPRFIVVGNPLIAYLEMTDKAAQYSKIINFTLDDGRVVRGIEMPKNFDEDTHLLGNFEVTEPEKVLQFMQEHGDNRYLRSGGIHTRMQTIGLSTNYNKLKITVNRKKIGYKMESEGWKNAFEGVVLQPIKAGGELTSTEVDIFSDEAKRIVDYLVRNYRFIIPKSMIPSAKEFFDIPQFTDTVGAEPEQGGRRAKRMEFPNGAVATKAVFIMKNGKKLYGYKLTNVSRKEVQENISGLAQPFEDGVFVMTGKSGLGKDQWEKLITAWGNPTSVEFSLSRNPVKRGVMAQVLRKAIAKIARVYDVRVVQSETDLPPEVMVKIIESEAVGRVRGVIYNGTIYLVADNISSQAQAQRIIAHELIGHYGVLAVVGKGMTALLNRVWLAYGRKGLQDIAEIYNLDLSKKEDRLKAASEKIAQMAETFEKPTLWQKVVGTIRKWLRKMGFDLVLSETDIAMILKGAQEFVRRGVTAVGYETHSEPHFSLHNTSAATAWRPEDTISDAIREGRPVEAVFRLLFTPLKPFHNALARNPELRKKAAAQIYGVKEAIHKNLPWLDRQIETVLNGVVDRRGLSKEYLELDTQRGNLATKLLNEAVEFIDRMLEVGIDNPEKAKAFHAVLTAEELAPEHWFNLAEDIRRRIVELGERAVELELISRESFERNKNAYLHRIYLEYEQNKSPLRRWADNTISYRSRKIYGKELMGRGIFKTLKPHQIAKWIGRMPEEGEQFVWIQKITQVEKSPKNPTGIWVVRNLFFKPGDANIPEGENYRSQGQFEVRYVQDNGNIILWRDFTKDERETMGEITDARYALARTYQLLSNDLANGEFFARIAANPEWVRSADDPTVDPATVVPPHKVHSLSTFTGYEWVLVPKSKVPKSGAKRYGKLAGKLVRAEIWRDLNQLEYMQRPGLWRDILLTFKLNKTARNPVVHFNNIMANIVLMDLADVRFSDLYKAIRAMYDQYKTGRNDWYREAQNHGVFGHSFAEQELKRDILEPLMDELAKEAGLGKGASEAVAQALLDKMPFNKQFAFMAKLIDRLWESNVQVGGKTRKIGIKPLDQGMLKFYQMEDEVFRLATYIRRRSQGMPAAEAGLAARDQFLNYDIRAPWINRLRTTVLPFVAYSYRAIPIVAQSIWQRPWKLAKYFTIAYAANALGYMLAEGDEDDERKSLRDEVQGYTWIGAPRMLRMGWYDKNNDPVFLDIRRYIPVGDVIDMEQYHSAIPLVPAPFMPAGPIPMAFEFLLNKTAFFGEEITNEKADDARLKALKTMQWLWKGYGPSAPWIPGSYYSEKILLASTGARDRLGREYSVAQAVASSFGIKLSGQNVDYNMTLKLLEAERTLQAIRYEMTVIEKDNAQGKITPWMYRLKKKAYMRQLNTLTENVKTLLE